MQIYDFTVAPNNQRQLDAPGTYFYYYSGSAGGADQTITLRGVSSGLRIVLKNGQSLRLPKDQAPETSWYIGNYANAATIVGTVIVGNGEIQDNRIQGDVSIIDGGKSRSLASSAFMGATAAGAVAAQFAGIQLWNPAATGKNIVLEKFSVSSGTAMIFNMGQNAAAMASLITNSGPKLLGSAVANIGVIRNGNNVASVITKILAANYVAANASMDYNLREPVVIPPGFGFVVEGSVVNTGITATFEWFEESTA